MRADRPSTDAVADPAYDVERGVWLLTRYRHVAAALGEPALVPVGASSDVALADLTLPAPMPAQARVPHRDMLARARESIDSTFATLRANQSIDLIADVAAPWALDLALDYVGARPEDAAGLASLARSIFVDAAMVTSPSAASAANAAVAELAVILGAAVEQSPLAVQAFVALSQTLSAFLGAAWLALIDDPPALALLRADPPLLPRAVEELLRHCGPSRVLFRRAVEPIARDEISLPANAIVALSLAAANHDPARFPEPHRLSFERDASGHLALGRGAHACAGASMIRAAARLAIGAFIAAPRQLTVAGDVEWLEGFAIRAPIGLPTLASVSRSAAP